MAKKKQTEESTDIQRISDVITSTAELAGDAANPRKITDEGAAGLRASLKRFGDLSGIVFNWQTGELVTGHQRMQQITAEYGELPIVPIDEHPQRAEIEDQVQSLAAAAMEAEMCKQEPANVGGDHPLWFQCEDTRSDRSFLLYLGHDCAFLAEIFDDASQCTGVAPLDEGQVLGNVLWLDEPPPAERQAVLWAEARRELRVYDKRLGL